LTSGDAAAAEPEFIDLGGEASAFCLERTGTAPKRPHMLMFNAGNTHAVLAFVATGHVLFMEAATRAPVACLDVGEQAHAAYPSPDESYVVVANQNGKLLQRLTTDYASGTFALDEAATLNLATCVTPSGAACEDPTLRPDNAPVCPIIESGGRFTAVTLRGGGLFVVDTLATPMAIVAEYDRQTIRPNGCGGLETSGKLYLNAGGGTKLVPYAADLYAFPLNALSTRPSPPNTPAPTTVFSYGDEGADAHGAVLTGGGAYVWVADRAANRIIVVDTALDEAVEEIDLTGPLTPDPAPDLMDVSPDGAWVFLALRGPQPLTANVEGVDNAVGASPGLGVVRVGPDGRTGELVGLAPISHAGDGGEIADPHGLRVRPTGP
jgi:DNA-binding beta-propeller fold protein YncE